MFDLGVLGTLASLHVRDRPVFVAIVVERGAVSRFSSDAAVWFDKSGQGPEDRRLTWGDDDETKIKRNIERAALFVPVVSKHTLTTRMRFFRIEWKHAERVAMQSPESIKSLPLTSLTRSGTSIPRLVNFQDEIGCARNGVPLIRAKSRRTTPLARTLIL